ncbi:hydrophobin-251 [Guyanagaster necrorhizus]|uniref:Hydrophobin n=1 Tax=Guyanagaster necrorhizus TaxID=856835 RepID=A0A9P7W402_9AGAR|nr:hydrophobin-251 [Guyanagaster necrorhizus MCA 3950]KAG7451560.1 hydrophobin-251 [Guyanagaster necrorhizus MCA 3950]
MFARIYALAFTLFFAMPLFVAGSAVPRGGTGCTTGEVQCCQSVQSATSTPVSTLLGLLGVVLGNLGVDVGVTCSPISVIGVGGNSCSTQTVCCEDNSFNGLIAIGCTPINIGL